MANENKKEIQVLREKTLAVIASGHIKKFSDILKYIDPTPFAKASGFYYPTWRTRIENPQTFNLSEIFRISEFLGIDREVVVKWILAEIDSRLKEK